MDDPGYDVREVPEPRLIAPHVLVGLECRTVASLGIAIREHRITDTTKHDQVEIRFSMGGVYREWTLHGGQPAKDVQPGGGDDESRGFPVCA
jgi:hypothetical protein